MVAGGVVIAVISEPRFAVGMVWPAGTGFSFHGPRSAGPDTVVVLVADEVAGAAAVIEDVGTDRALWWELQGASGGVLLLAVYAPQKNKGVEVRLGFWQDRVVELHSLRRRAKYRSWPLVVAGDWNTHPAHLADKNARYEDACDRLIIALAQAHDGLGVILRNLVGPTHQSGTALDLFAASPTLQMTVQPREAQQGRANSDHLRVDASIVFDMIGQPAVSPGMSRWAPGADREAALDSVASAQCVIAGWAGAAMRDVTLRQWVVDGARRGTR